MNKSKTSGNSVLVICLCVFAAILTVFTYLYNKNIGIAAAVILAVVILLLLLFKARIKRRYSNAISLAALLLNGQDADAIEKAHFPIMILSDKNEIVFCNSVFENTVCNPQNMIGRQVSDVFDEATLSRLSKFGTADTVLADKIFKAFTVGNDASVLFFIDQTELKRLANEYKFSRPVAAMLEIDSLEEVLKDEQSSKRAQVVGDIQKLIEDWFSITGGIIRKVSDSRYFLIFEERYLKNYEQEKFSIIEKVRNYELEDSLNFTLSMGVAYGCKKLKECENLSRQLLDMSLSRGGDQATVKSPATDYRFYGGVKAAGEKGSRVRSRITANSLKKLIMASSNVIVAGHKFSDLDSLGSALGIAAIVKSLGKNVNIVINRETSMAKSLLHFCVDNGLEELFVNDKEALKQITEETLVIFTDTHRPLFTDPENLSEKADKKVVIDHHRKATDYISDALIFYNDPISSSASEIVTEFWQYIGEENIGKTFANALLAGIMLDTKNFVLGTGVRTYEAAAYLRKCGADPITVKKLFADSAEIIKAKNEVVCGSQIYNSCAVAVNNTDNENVRLVSAQAADEMLGIDGVSASFVIFAIGDSVNISARSYGDMNVQIIMEKMGGGGHRTMSACSLKNTDTASVLRLLKDKIDEYLFER